MTLEKHRVPYEILFRLNDQGIVVGCHRKDLELWVDISTGKLENAKEMDPQPIVGDDMDDVLGLVNTRLTATLVERDNQLVHVNASLTASEVIIDTLTSEKNALVNDLVEVNISLHNAQVTIGSLTEQVNLLTQQLADANAQVAEPHRVVEPVE